MGLFPEVGDPHCSCLGEKLYFGFFSKTKWKVTLDIIIISTRGMVGLISQAGGKEKFGLLVRKLLDSDVTTMSELFLSILLP